MNNEYRIKKIGALIILVVLVILTGMAIRSCCLGDSKANKDSTLQTAEHSAKTPAERIEEALAYDHQVFQESYEHMAAVEGVNAACNELARVRKEYVSKMQSFVLANANLPADFRAILFEHISAHNRFANVMAAHPLLPNDSIEGFGIGALNFWFGKGLDGGAGELQQWVNDAKTADNNISETWDAVLQCAIKYGAQIKTEE